MPTTLDEVRPREPVHGPYGEVSWDAAAQKWVKRLTPEGRAKLDEHMVRYPEPVRLLHKLVPRQVDALKRMGASADDLASAAGLALVEAMIRYDPERSAASGRRVSFSTVIGWAILAVINKMMDDAIVRTSRKTVALGEHEYDVADTRHAVEAGTSSVLERLLARMTSQEREIVTMRYGIGRASMSYAEIAATKHFSKQRAEQIARSAIERVSARDRIASSTAHDCALLWLSLGPMTVDQMYEKIGSRMSEQVVEYMREAGEISPVPGPGIKTAWSLTEKGRSSANVVRQRNLL